MTLIKKVIETEIEYCVRRSDFPDNLTLNTYEEWTEAVLNAIQEQMNATDQVQKMMHPDVLAHIIRTEVEHLIEQSSPRMAPLRQLWLFPVFEKLACAFRSPEKHRRHDP